MTGLPTLYGLVGGGRGRYRRLVSGLRPTAYWRLAGDAVDYVGSHNGSVSGAPVSSAGALVGGGAGSLDFNGSSDYITVSYNAGLNPATFSITGWIYRDADTGAAESILDSRNSANTHGYWLSVRSTDKLGLSVGDGSSMSEVQSSTSIATGAWTHVAATYDGTSIRLYIDGVLDGGPTADGYSANPDGQTRIAARRNAVADLFNGKICELALHGSRVLTDNEVATLAAQTR